MKLESFARITGRLRTFGISAILTAAVCGMGPAYAIELSEFYRGVRAMGMGNAFTALSDDEDAVFYNPAGLAFNNTLEVHALNPKIDISTDDLESASLFQDAADSLDIGKLEKFFGKNIYGKATVFPSIHFPNFVMGYYYGGEIHVVSRNLAMPKVEARYLIDRGVVSGFGYEMRGFSRRHYMRVGATAKWITRTGYDGTIPFSELVGADKAYFQSLRRGPESSFGIGLGIQYEVPLSRSNEVILGTAWQDIGDTSFGNNLANNAPPSIRNNLAAGAAFVHRIGRIGRETTDFKLSAEFRHLLEEDKDPRLKAHIGTELRIGDIGIQAGVNQDSLTAGASVDMYFLKISAVTYGVQNQSLAFMDRERRYMAQITLKLDLGGGRIFKRKRDEDRRKRPRRY